jgi:hypothetical protein
VTKEAAMKPKPEPISVKDHLPANGDYVLAYNLYFEGSEDGEWFIACCLQDIPSEPWHVKQSESVEADLYNVTHWLPLPPSPFDEPYPACYEDSRLCQMEHIGWQWQVYQCRIMYEGTEKSKDVPETADKVMQCKFCHRQIIYKTLVRKNDHNRSDDCQ